MVDYLKEYFDFRALLLCLGLVLVGLLSVYSATFDVGAAAAFKKQLVWAGFGLLALFTMAFVPIRNLRGVSFIKNALHTLWVLRFFPALPGTFR